MPFVVRASFFAKIALSATLLHAVCAGAQTASFTPTWVQQSPSSSPPARQDASMVYDAATGQLVLFGGFDSFNSLSDTWTWNGTTWAQQSPSSSPSARYGASIAYDAATGQVVLFGGNGNSGILSDTWTWNGTTWVQQSPSSSPLGRYDASMAYDAATGQVVLFGGNGNSGILSDTWTWNGTTWVQQSPSSSPLGRYGASMAYDAATGQVVLFSGAVSGSMLSSDTWTWNGTTWVQQSPSSSPLGRYGASMAYGAATGQVVLFGGYNSSSGNLSDTWTWNGTTWVQQSPSSSPPAREVASMVYDTATGQVVLFGGFGNSGNLSDTWTLQIGAVNLGTANVCSSGTPTPCSQTATLTFTFSGPSQTIKAPVVLTQGAAGLDFTDAGTGTCTTNGTSHSYANGNTCTVVVKFAPKFPGQRMGSVELLNSSGTVIATELVYGTGTGPQVVFNAPLTPSTLGGGFSFPGSVAVDGNGNVYIADPGNSAVKVMAKTCTSSSCVSTLGGGFYFPYGVAVDGSGNVYVADYENNAVEVMANTCTSSSCVSTLGGGFNDPSDVAVDGGGNVYVADQGNSAVKVMSNTCTSSSCVSTLGGGFYLPIGVGVDGSGNVYVADTNHRAVKVMSNTCTSSSCVSTLGGGFNLPEGVAVDASGNVYVADYGSSALQVMSNTCTSSSCVSSLIGGLSFSQGVTVDGSGNVYVADQGNNAVKVMARATPPTVAFATTTTDGTTDTTDGTKTVTVQNIGNAALSFAIPGSGVTNPTTPTDFTFNTTGGSACPSLTSSASTTGSLAAGATCNIPLTFTPVSPASGALTESLVFTDNALNATGATQSITLQGTAIPPTPASTLKSTVVASPSPAVAGSTVTVTVTLEDSSGNAISGATATFSSASTTASFGTPTVNGNIITATMTDTAAETAPITVTLGGNASGTLTGSAQFVAPAYVVTVATDEASGNGTAANCVDPNISSSGNANCSLRDAVAAADALNGVTANISFSLPNPSTIQIASGTAIQITQNVNLNGPGANALTVEGGIAPYNGTTQTANYRILQISGGNVSITGLTFANAYTGPGGNGAAINLYGAGGTLTVSNSVFSGNIATLNGGAINTSSSLTVSNSTFSGNSANSSGGAIYAPSALTVSNSTFSGNSANGDGGAITASSLTVSSSTFSGNQAGIGGAIFVASPPTVSNSIFSGDSAGAGSGIFALHGGTVTKIVYNGDAFQGVTPVNSINADPKLSALGSYGGPTQTFLPLPGSPAICAGTQPSLNSTPLTTDQRGVTISGGRYGQSGCYDIGAVQTEYAVSFTTEPPASPTLVNPGVAMSPAPVATIKENGTALTAGAASVSVTDTASTSDLSNTSTLTATSSTVTATAGQASFSNLVFTGYESSDTLTAKLVLNSPLSITATSSAFTVGQLSQTITFTTAPPSSAAYNTQFTVVATGGGSGVALVYASSGGCSNVGGTYTMTSGTTACTVTVSQGGNTNYAAATNLVATVNASLVTPTLSFATIPQHTYGDAPFSVSASSASTGSVSYSLVSGPATVGSGGLVTLSGAGTVRLSASQQATSNYAQATGNTQFTVAQQASTTSLGVSATSITPLQTVTLTATVAPTVNGSATPTGSVTFFDGSTAPATQLGNAVTLVSGQAQLTGVVLPSGAHALYATYSSGTNYLASTSVVSAGTTVTVAPLDFTFTVTGLSTQSVIPGTAGVFTFALAPLYNVYPGAVTFTVSGLPSGATYTITPTTVAANGGPQTVTVTINTPKAIAMRSVGRSAPWMLAMLLPALLLRRTRRRLGHAVAMLLLLSAGAFALSGCGTNANGYFGQAVQNYTVTVTGTSGTVTHTTTTTLQVQ